MLLKMNIKIAKYVLYSVILTAICASDARVWNETLGRCAVIEIINDIVVWFGSTQNGANVAHKKVIFQQQHIVC